VKADVIPAVQLDIPSWVPVPIARFVRAKYDTDDYRPYQAALKSLACDPRMESVWYELSRRQAEKVKRFLNPTRAPGPAGVTAQEWQEAAMLRVFNVAVRCHGLRDRATMTRSQAERQYNHFLAKANELRADALMMLMPSRFRDELTDEAEAYYGYASDEERHQKLLAAAQAYEDYANEIHAANLATSRKRKHDGHARWVVLTIADTFRVLFDKPMYGLTAVITSIILGREITSRAVRQWCDPHPADKPSKIA
jgi:hypothetical protein